MAYITNANLNKIYKGINPSVVISDEELTNFLNGVDLTEEQKNILEEIILIDEKKALLALEMFLQNPRLIIDKKLIRLDWKDSYKYVHEFNPAYHANINCNKLHKDFEGIQIPEFIREKGVEAINEFRQWYTENEYLLKEEKNDVFAARLHAKYGIQSTIVDYHRNSGVTMVYNSIEELLNDLAKHVNEWLTTDESFDKAKIKRVCNAKDYLEEQLSEGKELFFAPDLKNRTTKEPFKAFIVRTTHKDKSFTEDMIPIAVAVADMNELKKVIKYLKVIEFVSGKHRIVIQNESIYNEIREILKWYYIFKYNPTLSFDEDLLCQLGFSPCSDCCWETILL